MSEPAESPCEQLRRQAWEAVQAGHLRQGLTLLDEALGLARRDGSEEQIDRALLNRAAVVVELGEGAQVRQELRRILLKRASSGTAFLAAYNLARYYETLKDFDKALFYARIAHDHVHRSDDRDWLSSSHNQLGNLFIAVSDFEGAQRELEIALDLVPDRSNLRRALALDNLGYCHVVQGRHRRGFKAHFEALRIIRRMGAPAWEAVVEVSICFAYLEIGRYRRAIQHGNAALHLAEQTDNREAVRNALFALGEAFKQAGEPLVARRHFVRLQQEFYPGAEGTVDLLLLMNVLRMVNIKA